MFRSTYWQRSSAFQTWQRCWVQTADTETYYSLILFTHIHSHILAFQTHATLHSYGASISMYLCGRMEVLEMCVCVYVCVSKSSVVCPLSLSLFLPYFLSFILSYQDRKSTRLNSSHT